MQTGLYPREAGVMTLYGFFGHTAHLGDEHRNVGQVFEGAGYTTAYFGKTHVGAQMEKVGYQDVVDRPQEYVRGQDTLNRASRPTTLRPTAAWTGRSSTQHAGFSANTIRRSRCS
jgi:arylsulfatase A-like enzyme